MLILSISFASFGESKIIFNREWTIFSEESKEVEFFANFGVNNSDQKIISIESSHNFEFKTDENGTITGKMKFVPKTNITKINATIIARIKYDPKIENEQIGVWKTQAIQSTELTEPDEQIRKEAHRMVDQSSAVKTATNMANFLHKTIDYDPSFWGKNIRATQVYQIKKGVCVEYTHLLLSMLRSLGLESRYVGGFAKGSGYQPHAWAQANIPDQGWLNIDPTFGEVGILDNTHYILAYSTDQSGIYDYIISKGDYARLESQDKIELVQEIESNEQENQGQIVKIEFNNQSLEVIVSITNMKKEMLFAKYQFSSYQKTQEEAIALEVGETKVFKHRINAEKLSDGFEYKIPVQIKINDLQINQEYTYSKIAKNNEAQYNVPEFSACLPSAIILLMAFFRTNQ